MAETPIQTTQEGLLAAIRTNPAEDTPRLVYADWLDEHMPAEVVCPRCEGRGFHGRNTTYQGTNLCPDCHGTGSVPSPERGHAELIRVQCELSPYPNASDTPQPRHMTPTSKWLELRRRERELLALHETAWRAGPVCTDCGGCGLTATMGCSTCYTGDAGGLLREYTYAPDPTGRTDRWGRELVRIEWDRGFISKVLVPRLSDVIEEGHTTEVTTHTHYRPTPLLLQLRTPTPYRCIQEIIPLDYEIIPLEIPRWMDQHYPNRESAVFPLGKAIALFNASL